MLRFMSRTLSLPNGEACAAAISSESAKTADALPSAQEARDSSTLRAQELSSLTKIIVAWPFRA